MWMKRYPRPFASGPTVADQIQAFDGMIKEICNALIEADVNIKLISGLRKSIRSTVNFKELAPGVNKKKIIQKVNESLAGRYPPR
jgi:signal recognition particle GTPase